MKRSRPGSSARRAPDEVRRRAHGQDAVRRSPVRIRPPRRRPASARSCRRAAPSHRAKAPAGERSATPTRKPAAQAGRTPAGPARGDMAPLASTSAPPQAVGVEEIRAETDALSSGPGARRGAASRARARRGSRPAPLRELRQRATSCTSGRTSYLLSVPEGPSFSRAYRPSVSSSSRVSTRSTRRSGRSCCSSSAA